MLLTYGILISIVVDTWNTAIIATWTLHTILNMSKHRKKRGKGGTQASAMNSSTDEDDLIAGGDIDESIKDLIKTFMNGFKAELLNTVKKEITKLVTMLDEVKSTLDKQSIELNRSLEEAFTRINEVSAKNIALEKRTSKLEAELEAVKKKMTSYSAQFEELYEKQLATDSYNRRENLIVYGIHQMKEEKCLETFQAFMVNQLHIPNETVKQMKIQRCHRLPSTAKPQPMICRFLYFPDRMSVWAARTQLKNTHYSMSEDFSAEIVSRRKILYPILKAAQRNNKLCRLVGDKLILEGRTYTCKTLHTLPPEYNPAKLATISKNGVTAFFTISSPLSNFYPCEIELNGITYSSVEQYLQAEKARYAGNPDMATQICATNEPARCKSLGGKIVVDEDQWLPFAKEAVKKACRLKFTKNDVAKKYLMDSKDTILCEAGPDKVWGVGRLLSDPKVHIKNEWLGNNELGTILEAIRSEL